MTQLAIVADDLTGAADSAALFAQAGFATAVPLSDRVTLDADVLSVSTDSRELSATAAEDRVRSAIAGLSACGGAPTLVYKKLDSALRGQLRAELMAAMSELGAARAVVAPALPAERRTTIGGRQHVDGRPLEQSSFGREGISSDLIATFRGGSADIPVIPIGLEAFRSGAQALTESFGSPGIFVVDAETDDHLESIARAALSAGICLLAGSAGLARALVRVANLEPGATPPSWRPAAGRPILAILGTQHPATARQIERAVGTGICVIQPDQQSLDEPDGRLDDAIAAVELEVRAGRHVILTTAGRQSSPLGPAAIAERLSTVLDSAIVRATVGGMMISGGDVAAAACDRLGTTAIWLRGEVRPAIPWGTLAGGALSGVPIVTKAGSFGDDSTLIDCIEHLLSAT